MRNESSDITHPDLDQIFRQIVEFGLENRSDDGDKAIFLNSELEKWEDTEDKLLAWAQRDDGSPNPFTPALDPTEVASIIVGLNSRLDGLVGAGAFAIAS